MPVQPPVTPRWPWAIDLQLLHLYDPHGTFTGYATPDFVNFAIQITLDAPV